MTNLPIELSAAYKLAVKSEQYSESDNLSFSEDTSAKTGKSKRTVERDAAVGAKLDDKAVAKLQGHAVANNKTELTKLAAPSVVRALCWRGWSGRGDQKKVTASYLFSATLASSHRWQTVADVGDRRSAAGFLFGGGGVSLTPFRA